MNVMEFKVAHDERVYPPSEDSYLLIESINPEMSDSALEIGVGSGIISLHLAKEIENVYGCDINPYSLILAKQNAIANSVENIHFFSSDLFSSIKLGSLFDIIVFNPPYLPVDSPPKDLIDLSYHGGTDGGRHIRSFLNSFGQFLSKSGKAYLLQSSLYPLENTIDFLEKRKFWYNIKNCLKLDFETLHVFEIGFL